MLPFRRPVTCAPGVYWAFWKPKIDVNTFKPSPGRVLDIDSFLVTQSPPFLCRLFMVLAPNTPLRLFRSLVRHQVHRKTLNPCSDCRGHGSADVRWPTGLFNPLPKVYRPFWVLHREQYLQKCLCILWLVLPACGMLFLEDFTRCL